MANSNSKLTKTQKAHRKAMREAFTRIGGTVHSFPEYGVTIGIVPNPKMGDAPSRTAQMYVSIASNDEKKFRAKVGEYHMLARWDMGDSGALVPNPSYPHEFAEAIACTIGDETQWQDSHNSEGVQDFGF